MSFVAGAITGGLEFDVSQYVRGMMQVNSIAAVFPQTVTNFMANPLLGVIGLLKDAANALSGWVTDVANAADSADKLATSLGLDVEFLTAYTKAAELNGAAAEDVAQAFQFLNRSMADAAEGKETANTFARLGVQIRSASGAMRPASDVMLELGDAIRNLPDGAQRTGVAMDLMGRGAGKMIVTFMQGREEIGRLMDESRAFGAVTTEEEGKAAAAWNDLKEEIAWVWEGIRKMIAMPIIESLTPYLQSILDWFRENPEMIKAKAKEIAAIIVSAVETIANAVMFLAEHLRTILVLSSALAGAWAGIKIGSAFGPTGAIVGAAIGGGAGLIGGVAATQPPAQVTNNYHFQANMPGATRADWEAQQRRAWNQWSQYMAGDQSRANVEAGL